MTMGLLARWRCWPTFVTAVMLFIATVMPTCAGGDSSRNDAIGNLVGSAAMAECSARAAGCRISSWRWPAAALAIWSGLAVAETCAREMLAARSGGACQTVSRLPAGH